MNPHIGDISNLEQFDAASFEKIYGDHVWSMSEVKWHALRMMLGGQVDEYDYHYVGFNQQILYDFLKQAGFSDAVRVDSFGIFSDTSDFKPYGFPISLNVIATR